MLKDFDTIFEEFLTKIALTKTQAQRIDSSMLGLSQLFIESLSGDVDIYAQGSFATNTIVKPLRANQTSDGKAGEYDVDIVLQRLSWTGASDSLSEIRSIVGSSDRYSVLLEPPYKQSCERVKYAEDQSGAGYHVDLVPIKIDTSSNKYVAIRNSNSWEPSDPTIIINWFNALQRVNKFISAIVICLKRMRDVAGLQITIPSIIVLALVGAFYEDRGSYADDLLGVLEKIVQLLDWDTVNISIPGIDENLADKWDSTQLSIVQDFFNNAYTALKRAFDSNDLDTIRMYLSDDFPSDKYLEELHSLRSKGWKIQLDGSLARPVITPIPEPSDFNRRTRRLLKFKRKGAQVVFNAEPYALGDNKILKWQVLNEEGSEQIRGDLFDAKNSSNKISANIFENHETVQYKGIHWIRYFVIDTSNDTVEVASRKYSVELNL